MSDRIECIQLYRRGGIQLCKPMRRSKFHRSDSCEMHISSSIASFWIKISLEDKLKSIDCKQEEISNAMLSTLYTFTPKYSKRILW